MSDESAERLTVLIAYPGVDLMVTVSICDVVENKQRRIERQANPDAEYLRTLVPSLSDAQSPARSDSPAATRRSLTL